jgi:proteasome accessory factor A
LKRRIYGLETEYGLLFSSSGRTNLPPESALLYLFENLFSRQSRTNIFLKNGARLYQDTGCHPEYATPECDSILDVVTHDKAGERILESLIDSAEKKLRREGVRGKIFIFKNNTDSVGNTYGCHENYLITRNLDFQKIAEELIPFFVTRQVYAGSGKILKTSAGHRYFISQRAQHIYQKISGATTSSRSVINTRDEPHADRERYRRLHVIVGDSNMSEISTFLKVGLTALVLGVLEGGGSFGMELDDPVRAIRQISRDPTCRASVGLVDGRRLTGVQVQREYLEIVDGYYHGRRRCPIIDDLIARWHRVLDALEADPMELSREVDWVIKKRMIEGYMRRKGVGWDDDRVSVMDLQYHNISRERGLYYLAERRGMVDREIHEEDVRLAIELPPQTTRAKIRGDFVREANRLRKSYSVDWGYLKLNDHFQKTVICKDPFRSYDPRVERMISSS